MTIDTIVTDLDDTLLDGSGQLSAYTIEVMAEVKRRGIRLIPCSGRTHASMYPFLAKLDTGLPYIGGNGSEIVGADHRLMEQLTLDVELAREICAFLEQNGLYVQVYTDEAFYYSAECDIARRYKQSSGMKGVAVGDVCAFLSFATPKVLSVGEPEDVLRLMPLANERFLGRATFTMSKPYFLEAEPPGATKGEALCAWRTASASCRSAPWPLATASTTRAFWPSPPTAWPWPTPSPSCARRRPTSAAPTRRTAWPASWRSTSCKEAPE